MTVAVGGLQVLAACGIAPTPAPATVQAAATQVAATFGAPIATTVAASPAQIAAVRGNKEDTTIVVGNTGTAQLNISAWILLLGSLPLVLPVSPNLRIEPGLTDAPTDVYLGQAPQPLVNSLRPGGQVANVYQLR